VLHDSVNKNINFEIDEINQLFALYKDLLPVWTAAKNEIISFLEQNTNS